MPVSLKKVHKSRPLDEYKEDMRQRWVTNTYSRHHSDQFGFVIEYGRIYKLYWKGTFITQTFSLAAAKEISLILLNDSILHC